MRLFYNELIFLSIYSFARKLEFEALQFASRSFAILTNAKER
jgi:hypothetical protein